jgi:predicted MFS family arabinose efflux permease
MGTASTAVASSTVLRRTIDASYSEIVRESVGPLMVSRLASNATYRFAPPFIAIIAAGTAGFDVSIADVGIAISISELSGFLAPALGWLVDRLSRRASVAIGLLGCILGAFVVAASPNVVVFAVGLTMINLLKSLYDLGTAAWIADHVPYEKRGRIVGITEMSWALGLLLGVSAMGVVTALSSWRWGYVAGGVAVAVTGVVLDARLRHDGVATVRRDRTRGGTSSHGSKMRGRSWFVPLSMFGLMGASQCIFVTFGAWLADDFGIGAFGLAATGFVLGAVELVSSVTSARKTDSWGKERSVLVGAAVMIPTALALALTADRMYVGLAAIALLILGFEFAVVSMLPLATHLVPEAPGKGFGAVIGAGTFGRGVMSLVATAAYATNGIAGAALASIVCAALAGASIVGFGRGAANAAN